MRKLMWAVLCMFAAPAAAQDANGWQMLAKGDADAAIALIESSHPGAAPELGDTAFQALLADARRHVAERLPKVSDFGGYSALMSGLATDFRDGHIWSNPAGIGLTARRWAGLAIIRRGGRWVVGAQRAEEGEPALTGATLVSCDGEAADGWARARLGQFGANPGVEASLARRAPTLLLDDGNPFLTRPKACAFELDGKPVTLTLNWRNIAQAELQTLVATAMQPARAGMGVRAFASGYWIALETLGDGAEAVVAEVRARQAALRAAPMVVLDMRGNGGGNSRYGSEIAALLAGEAPVDAADIGVPSCSGAFWRVSPGNVETLKRISARTAGQGGWDVLAADGEKALAEGRGFTPALPPCASSVRPAAPARTRKLPASAMRGRLVVLTDRACFSSCLIVADLFRRLGALHAGEATDVSTRYMEVREIVLPSGLRTFSTLQKVAVGLGDFGPYAPAQVYPGVMADTGALERWVTALR